MQMNGTQSMGDKEILSDLLSSQKFTTTNYNTFAGECQCNELRNTLMSILEDEHCIQNDIWTEQHNRGWYPVKTAPMTDIDAARQKFMQG